MINLVMEHVLALRELNAIFKKKPSLLKRKKNGKGF